FHSLDPTARTRTTARGEAPEPGTHRRAIPVDPTFLRTEGRLHHAAPGRRVRDAPARKAGRAVVIRTAAGTRRIQRAAAAAPTPEQRHTRRNQETPHPRHRSFRSYERPSHELSTGMIE